METTTRKEARAAGLKRYYTGKPCKRGHVAERLVSNWSCLDCLRDAKAYDRRANPEKLANRRRAWVTKNPERHAENRQRWLRENRDSYLRTKKNYRETHRDEIHASNSKWQKENRDRMNANDKKYRDANKEKNSARIKKWCEANPHMVNARTARRRARKLRATPAWLTEEHHQKILDIYTEAAERDGDWHVDHIIPLKGKNVRGLHVPWNLQVLPARENISKGNRMVALDAMPRDGR